ncbi:acetate/propionate family kinase [Sulfuriflexus mobilis]|uniref:acetate/propionate family kinase n=1 Tax=Sulfuriflexus mobilis TaxID=1811807 RepID=UPI000F84D4F8|nr:acetate kinase [Sulfuriflexus mobilis]
MRVLVINSGSSSIKFRLYDMGQEVLLMSGTLERIGETRGKSVYREYAGHGKVKEYKQNSSVIDHAAGLKQIFAFLQSHGAIDSIKSDSIKSLHAIGHRVVHGGEAFQAPMRIDADVIDGIRNMIPLAPLHNPANLAGIEAAQRLCPQVPQVAVFDTAFFRDLPPQAYRYALPDKLYRQHHVRRYGFHGTSHQYVARQAAEYMQQPLESLRLITLHLGNGASAAAIRDGICIDTSMGMTPLEGLIMGTRCGDLDPSIHFYLTRTLGMGLDEIETLLNHDSGMQGLCGVSDMREVHRLVNEGNEQARLAIDMYCYRISKYIGAYSVALGGLDALVFTGGVGENDGVIRQTVCNRLSLFGISLDHQQNQAGARGIFDISGEDSKVKVLVVHTNEELEIARQTVSFIDKSNVP